MEHGTSLRLERLAGTAEWPGPGRALMLKNPAKLSSDSRTPRPADAGGPWRGRQRNHMDLIASY